MRAAKDDRSTVARLVPLVAVAAAVAVAVVAWRRQRRAARHRLSSGEQRPGPDVALDARTTGKGVHVVVNPDAGPLLSSDKGDDLAARLPDASVVELSEGDDLPELLEQGVKAGAAALGMAGGDGSVNCAAGIAADHDLPLLVVPGGTLNHLARDLGVESVEDAVEAVRKGRAIEMRLGEIDGRLFLNTASFGGYVEMVDLRERYERYVGKWPAVLVALVKVLWSSEPLDLEIGGRRRKVWLVFVGNGEYQPRGFVPNRRLRLDDDQLDIRLVEGTRPWARARLVGAVLTGTLAHSAPYDEFRCRSLEVRSHSGPLRLAVDGETFDGAESFTICKRPAPLTVYAP